MKRPQNFSESTEKRGNSIDPSDPQSYVSRRWKAGRQGIRWNDPETQPILADYR